MKCCDFQSSLRRLAPVIPLFYIRAARARDILEARLTPVGSLKKMEEEQFGCMYISCYSNLTENGASIFEDIGHKSE